MRSKWLGCLLVVAAACGDSAEEPWGGVGPGATGGGGLADSGAPITTPGTTGGGPIVPTLGGGITAGTQPGTTAGTAGGTTAGTTPTAGGLPCDVDKILKEKCQTCHSNPPTGSAPYALTTLADLNANSPTFAGQKVSARVKVRINDTKLPMPPAARPQLTAAEKATLEAYINGGLKPSTTACGAPPTTGGTGGTGGGSTGGVALGGDWLPPDSDCDVLMEMRAHGGQGVNDTTPFTAPQGGDNYEIFWFAPTWNEKMHVIRIDPLIDNKAVLHHWLLYMKATGTEAVGSHNPDSGLQSADSSLLSGWAPGNKNIPLGTEVGLQVVQGPQARFGIEIHYNTGSNPAVRTDRSGARLCLTKKHRPKEASTHWLGTETGILFTQQAIGTCNVPGTSHIIAHSPHMHKTGKYMKTIVTKKNGSKVTITDKPFDFNDQQIFPVDAPGGEIVVEAGDVITTTCDYTTIATFGPGTDSEMCYNFVIAWPAGSLSSGTGLVGGKNTCIELF
jgi:hypothetical protein